MSQDYWADLHAGGGSQGLDPIIESEESSESGLGLR